jgi:hypothetical protein
VSGSFDVRVISFVIVSIGPQCGEQSAKLALFVNFLAMSFIKNLPLFALSVEKFRNVKKTLIFAIISPNCHFLNI